MVVEGWVLTGSGGSSGVDNIVAIRNMGNLGKAENVVRKAEKCGKGWQLRQGGKGSQSGQCG